MPSELPKVTVYLKPETRAALDAASAALGRSRSKLVADLLDSAIPVLQAVTDAALVVANVGDMQREVLANLAEQVTPMQGEAEELISRVIALANKTAGKDEGKDDEGPDPRPSNTGVRI